MTYIYAHDPQLMVLLERDKNLYNITIVPTVKADEYKSLPTESIPKPTRFDWNRLAKREQQNWRRREQQLSPQGVTEEARLLFEALGKTLPCRWHTDNQTIIVMDEIYICPPYRPNSCRGNMRTPAALIERVRRVVELERQRLKLEP